MLSAGLPQGTVPKLERPGPLRERVYEALLELITTRALRPGQHLVESELAGHLGVSRQPVREALQRLNTEGWVDLRPAQGAFVHEPTEAEADQLLSVRTLLEAEAARLAAANSGSAGIAALEELCAQGEQAVADDDVDLAVATNAGLPRQGDGARRKSRPGRAGGTGGPPGPLVLHAGRAAARQAVLDRAPGADRGDLGPRRAARDGGHAGAHGAHAQDLPPARAVGRADRALGGLSRAIRSW